MKTREIFQCTFGGQNVIIIYHYGKINPFRIYRKYWKEGWHKEMLNKYADFNSCLCFVNSYYRENTNVYSETLV